MVWWYYTAIPTIPPKYKKFYCKTVLIPKENNRRYFLDISHHAVCLL